LFSLILTWILIPRYGGIKEVQMNR